MAEFTKQDLQAFQAEPLEGKIQRTLAKVSEWYSYWNGEVYVSFSGGKDSTVLADICARWCKIINKPLYLVFVNTGLEYPEIQKHVKFFAEWLREKYGIAVELEILRPKMRFDEVIKTYGYPIISKSVSDCVRGAKMGQQSRINLLNGLDCDGADRKSKFSKLKYKPLLTVDFEVSERCCDIMKKKPGGDYQKRTGRKPILATMAVESMLREKDWVQRGCNAFSGRQPASRPMSFWTEQDVLQYIKERDIPIASVYGSVEYAIDPEQIRWGEIDPEFSVFENKEQRMLTTTGCSRTGCIFCGFGCHLEKEPSRFQKLKETHPRQYEYCIGGGEYDENGVWKPNKQGLGMGHVFEELNKIYGEGFIKY